MSTKIYNGLKINANSIDKAFREIKPLKKDFAEFVYEDISISSMNRIVSKVNMVFLYMYLNGDLKINFVGSELDDDMTKDYVRIYDSLKKFSLYENSMNLAEETCYNNKGSEDLAIYPVQAGKNYCLAASLLSKDDYTNYLIKASKNLISEYAYYNNTDQPEHISDSDWNKRGKEWDLALDGNDSLRMSGLIIKLINYQELHFSVVKDWDEFKDKIINKFNNQAIKTQDYRDNFINRVFIEYLGSQGINPSSYIQIVELRKKIKERQFDSQDHEFVYDKIAHVVNSFDAADYMINTSLNIESLHEKFKSYISVSEACNAKDAKTGQNSKIKI